jgi:DUF4097 and DUF4098 domain-containing protein YvlB
VNIKKIMTVAFILIGISIVGNIALFMFGQSPFNLAKIEEERSISAEKITDIQIFSNIGDVNVVPYEGDEIQVSMKGKTEKKWTDDFWLLLEEKNNRVTIEANQIEKARFFNFYSGTYELLVKMPKKEFATIEVHSDVANIDLSGVAANHYKIKTTMGDIHGNQLKGIVHAESEVGDIDLQFQNILNDIVAESEMGNITVTSEEAPEALQTDLTNSMGDETIKLPNGKNGSIGAGGPLVKLTTEVGDLALKVDNE